VPPHGVTTLIEAVPALAMRAAGTAAVSCVAETNVVVRAVPFHLTVEPETKLLPFTVSVNPGPPAVVQLGLSELTVGTALIVMTSVCCALVLQGVAPLLAVMVTLVVPAVVGVPEISPVLVLTARPAGSGLAVKLVGLLVAVIVYEKAAPTVPHAVGGLVITGVLTIVNVCAFDGGPLQFLTVTCAVPAVAMFAAGTTAVSRVAETNVVTSAEPFQLTTDVAS